MKFKRIFFLFSVLCALFSVSISAFADTVEMRDGRELKGIVVEDYHDRLTFSTPDGEVQVMKSDIRELSYDTEEDNLVRLGERARDRNDYASSYAYYEKALKINPDSKSAKEGLVYIQGVMFRVKEAKKEEDVKRRADYERYQAMGPEERTKEEIVTGEMDDLKAKAGFSLKVIANNIAVAEVVPGSPAYTAGLKKGDYLVALWGKLTGYMSLGDAVATLLKPGSIEIKATIERGIDVAIARRGFFVSGLKEMIGAVFSMEFDGLTVSDLKEGGAADLAGLKARDLVVAIDGKLTRYMPLKDAIRLIRKKRNGSVNLRIRRDTTIWRQS